MPLGMKMAPLIPRVPAVVTCGCWMYLWHVWIALMYFFGLGSATDPDQLTVRRPNRRLYGQSCRSLFAILWFRRVPKKGRVLISPLHHHSFIKMMKKTPERQLDVIVQDGIRLLEPENATAMDYDCVVLTQMLGRDYEFPWLAEWRKQNPNLLVINDRVQGGPITREDKSCSDVSLYSVGQDKIPNTMGGGFADVHHDDDLFDFMVTETESLPFESAWDRLAFMLKKIPTVGIYNVQWFCSLFGWLAGIAGIPRPKIVDGYRKTNPGFMHDGYMIRPCPALLHSMRALESEGEMEKWEAMQLACDVKFAKFFSYLPEELVDKVAIAGAQTACSYFFIRVPTMEKSRDLLALHGVLSIKNQTYLPANARSKPLVENMCTLPMLSWLTDVELKRVADAVADCWTSFEEETEAVDEGTGYGTAAWAGLA